MQVLTDNGCCGKEEEADLYGPACPRTILRQIEEDRCI